jgi:hypothetical protein
MSDDAANRLWRFDDDAKARFAAMKQRHADELARHDEEHPVETPPKFRRRSPQLLEKFRQERRLFFQSRFAEATAMRRECAAIDAEEAADAYRRALDHWNAVGAQIAAKHRREEDAMRHWIELRQTEIRREAEFADEAIERRKRLLTGAITDTEESLRRSAPPAITRSLAFNRTPARGTVFTVSDTDEINRLYEQLPDASKKVLLNL